MRSPNSHENGLVAILDALGAAAYSEKKIERFMDAQKIVVDLAKEKAQEILGQGIAEELLSVFTFNDTIIFALKAKNGSPHPKIGEAAAFFSLLRKFMIDSFENGILFRGAISMGTFYTNEKTNTVMGEAVTDAASWYTQANWIGIHATPRATIRFGSLLETEDENRSSVMIDYPVPMKVGSAIMLKVVNWPKALFLPRLVSKTILDAPRAAVLSWFGEQPIPKGAEDKCVNAITFFDAIVKEQKLRSGSSTSVLKNHVSKPR